MYYILSLVYWQLLLYGVHVGHSFANSTIFSGWLVYTYRQIILIINLFKTKLSFKNGYVGLDYAVAYGLPIWFINLHRSVELYVNHFAKTSGEFCYSTYWIHGLISNWISLANTFRKLFRTILGSYKGKFAKLEMDSSPWDMGRWSWPRAAFVSSVSTSPHPTKECIYAGIPCIGIVDTDISGHIANIATPGNDDSLDCIILYNTHISQYIIEQKYHGVSAWFYNIRKMRKLIKFKEWVIMNYINRFGNVDHLKKKKRIKFFANIQRNLIIDLNFKVKINNDFLGLQFFFAKNSGLDNIREQVDLYEPSDFPKYSGFEMKKLFLTFKKKIVFLLKTLNFYYVKFAWLLNRFISKRNLSNAIFKVKFMRGVNYEIDFKCKDALFRNFFFVRFLKNRIFKTFLRRNKYRFGKFTINFVKFLYVLKYYKCWKGMVSIQSSNFFTVSSFAFVSMSYCSHFFSKKLWSPVMQISNSFYTFFLLKKINNLSKWGLFKNSVESYLKSIIFNNKIDKNLKMLFISKTTSRLKKYIYLKLQNIYIYINLYFTFIFWLRRRHKHHYGRAKRLLQRRWLILKEITKNLMSLIIFKKVFFSYNKFKFLFLNKTKNLNLKNFQIYSKYFDLNYRKKHFLNKLFQVYYLRSYKLLLKYFKRVIKTNKRSRKVNRSINILEYKFGKFKHLKNREQDQYKQKFIKNTIMQNFKIKNSRRKRDKLYYTPFRKFCYWKRKKLVIKKAKIYVWNRNMYHVTRCFIKKKFKFYNYLLIDVDLKNWKNFYLFVNNINNSYLYKNLIKNFFNLKLCQKYFKNVIKKKFFFNKAFFSVLKTKNSVIWNFKIVRDFYVKIYSKYFNKNFIFLKQNFIIYNIIEFYYPLYFNMKSKLNTWKIISYIPYAMKKNKNPYVTGFFFKGRWTIYYWNWFNYFTIFMSLICIFLKCRLVISKKKLNLINNLCQSV